MFDDGAPPHLISHSVNRSILSPIRKFRYLTANEKKKEKHSILVCTCQQFHLWSGEIRELIVRKTTGLNKKGIKRKKKKERISERKEMTNPSVHILADQDQLTGHSQGRFSTDKDRDSTKSDDNDLLYNDQILNRC